MFTEKFPTYDTAEVFVVRIDPNIDLTDEFLRSLYYVLWFPGYFGFNWDALYDCLCDLSWLPCRKIVLLHDSLPQIPKLDLEIYFGILRDAVLDWKNNEEHELEVVLLNSDRHAIEKLLITS
ncbi:barstar family protein [Leclercia adecarboxylata]|nr:barstar family protein [Leclercia adecarboxylata]URO01542.1 barstar family protein [Leclercia adecarboxylata]